MLEPVKKGDKLTAAKENQKIAEINAINDRLNTLYIPNNANGGIICTIKNSTGSHKTTGSVLAVSGIRKNGNKDTLLALYQNSGIQLSGSTPSSSSSVLAFLLEAIPNNGIGKCFVPNVIGSLITIADSSHSYANPSSSGLTTCVYGIYRIIAKSNENSGVGFAIIIPNQNGHIRGTVLSKITGTSGSGSTAQVKLTNNAILDDIGCPLLRSDESIEYNSRVVLSWNMLEMKYEIIEAQCPSEGSGSR